MCVYRACVCVLGLATQSKVSENAIKNDVQHFKTMSLVCPCRKMYETWATCSCVPHYLLPSSLTPSPRWNWTSKVHVAHGTVTQCVCVCGYFYCYYQYIALR